MGFELKKTLIGVAALSLLLPVASHAQTSKGQWIVDGFSRSPRTGQGTTCLSAGGPDHAFDAANCTTAAAEAQTSREATIAAKKAADEEAKAATAARRAAEQDKLLEVEPGSGLKPGQRGAYAYDTNSGDIRDGLGRNCIKDGRWGVPLATESCEPELYNGWRARQQKAPASDLAPRLSYTADEADRSAVGSSVADSDLAKRIDQPPPLKARSALDDVDMSPGVAPSAAGAGAAEPAPIVDNSLPDFPITTYAAGGAAAAGLAAAAVAGDDDDDDAKKKAGDDDEVDEGPAEVYADEEVTPDMMLSDADRALPADGDPEDDRPMPEDDLLAENSRDEVYGDDDVTPDMMLSDADRALPPDTVVAAAAAEQAAPKPTPAPVVAAPRDDTIPDFPVTKYNADGAAAKAEPAKPAAPKPPTELPVTIKSDGLFGFDRTDLREELIIKLDAVADMLNGAKYDKITVVGHADPIGPESYNQPLSERRAEAVKKYLVGKGVDPSRIETMGKGESELVVKYSDCTGKRKKALIECFEPNRRVVIDAAGTKSAK